MSYDEERQRKSRVVVETPTERREVYQTQTTRHPPERGGYSTGTVAAVAVTAMALTAVIFLFLMTRGDDTTEVNVNASATPYPQASIAAAEPTPFVMPTPMPMTTPPVDTLVITPPAGTTTTTTTVPGAVVPPVTTAPTPNVPDDAALQSTVNKRIQDDTALGATGIAVVVSEGKATLTGSVNTPDLKGRAERIALSVRGVRRVDNQIAVTAAPNPDLEPATP